jgi:hypothetical protein
MRLRRPQPSGSVSATIAMCSGRRPSARTSSRRSGGALGVPSRDRRLSRAEDAALRPSQPDASRLLESRLTPSPAVRVIGESFPLLDLRKKTLGDPSATRVTIPPALAHPRAWPLVAQRRRDLADFARTARGQAVRAPPRILCSRRARATRTRVFGRGAPALAGKDPRVARAKPGARILDRIRTLKRQSQTTQL